MIHVLLIGGHEDEYAHVRDLLRAAGAGKAAGEEKFDLTWALTCEQGRPAVLSGYFDVALVDGLERLAKIGGVETGGAETKIGAVETPLILLSSRADSDCAPTCAADHLFQGELTTALLERSIRYAIEHGKVQKALNAARQTSESLNHAKSEFLALMSHEVRTPMNSILGMADMLSESRLDAEQRNYVETFRRAGSALMNLIEDVFDTSKIEAGLVDLGSVEFDLEELLDQAIEQIAPKAREKGLVLMLRAQPDLPARLRGDPARVKQILHTLIGNAVKHTLRGEIVLNVRNADGSTEFAVSDTGIGIDAERIASIFEEARPADLSCGLNSGLSLAACRKLAQCMGGRLNAMSEPGKGSRFLFRAPLETVAPAPAPRLELRGLRALIVDSNSTSRQILVELLTSWGMDCRNPGRPQDALAHLQAQAFDVALIVGQEAPDAPNTRMVVLSLEDQPMRRRQLFRMLCAAMEIVASETAASPVVGAQAAAQQVAAQQPRALRILVAEDAPDNQLLLRAYLKGSPYSLSFAADGKAALDAYCNDHFHLILMDIRMPVMDGLSATRAIREFERERGLRPTPILALSANASPADVTLSVDAGCQVHLAKPISKGLLLASIDDHAPQPSPAAPNSESRFPQYAQDRGKALAAIPELLRAGNFAGIGAIGHSLKESGSAHGFPEASRLGIAMEGAAISRQTYAVLQNLADLHRIMINLEPDCGPNAAPDPGDELAAFLATELSHCYARLR